MENISLVGSFKVHCDPTSSCNVAAQGSATLQSRQLLHRPFCRAQEAQECEVFAGEIVRADGLLRRCQLTVHVPVGT